MKFKLREWKRFYETTIELGRLLKNSKPDKDGNSPKSPLHAVTQANIEIEIKRITKNCSGYLDSCNLPMPAPLWVYKADDEKTWPSSKHFAYNEFLIK